MLNQKIFDYIEAHSQEAYELLLTLTRIPAPSNYEEKRAESCRDWLAAQGARGMHVGEALGVVYPMEAEGPVEVYMARIDVVSPDTRELSLTMGNGRVCCPDVGDDTACLVCLLMTAKYTAAHVGKFDWDALHGQGKPGLVPACNTGEKGLRNLRGVREICETHGTRMESLCTFDSSLDGIVNQAAGSKCFGVTVSAQGEHSFSDLGQDNTIAKPVGIMVRLYEIQVLEGLRTTYDVGLISGGTSVNTTAQQVEALYEVCSEPGESLELMEGRFTPIIRQVRVEGLDVSVEVVGVRSCGGDVDPDEEKASTDRAMEVVRQATGNMPRRGFGSTDCNTPLSLNIPNVCVGCYRGEDVHIRSEHVEADSLKRGYQVIFDMILG